jgi:hypothetical protein
VCRTGRARRVHLRRVHRPTTDLARSRCRPPDHVLPTARVFICGGVSDPPIRCVGHPNDPKGGVAHAPVPLSHRADPPLDGRHTTPPTPSRTPLVLGGNTHATKPLWHTTSTTLLLRPARRLTRSSATAGGTIHLRSSVPPFVPLLVSPHLRPAAFDDVPTEPTKSARRRRPDRSEAAGHDAHRRGGGSVHRTPVTAVYAHATTGQSVGRSGQWIRRSGRLAGARNRQPTPHLDISLHACPAGRRRQPHARRFACQKSCARFRLRRAPQRNPRHTSYRARRRGTPARATRHVADQPCGAWFARHERGPRRSRLSGAASPCRPHSSLRCRWTGRRAAARRGLGFRPLPPSRSVTSPHDRARACLRPGSGGLQSSCSVSRSLRLPQHPRSS